MASDLVGDELTNPDDELSPEDERRARLVVCGRARDVDDARVLLSALGLIPTIEEGPSA